MLNTRIYGSICFLLIFFRHIASESVDESFLNEFCYPDTINSTQHACQCVNDGEAPWGEPAVRIDCSYKGLKATDLTSKLPVYANNLDVSWNALNSLPAFYSDSLLILNAMHNNITRLQSKNFVDISNLRELYLTWNSIQIIEMDAFQDLAHLQLLDLSHNNVHALAGKIFAPLLDLKSLNLAWNRNLLLEQQQQNFFTNYALSLKLQTLSLEACNLVDLNLQTQANLTVLNLRGNELTRIPNNLPTSLLKLDMSANLLQALLPSDTVVHKQLQVLLLEDMPQLEAVAENAFSNMSSLSTVSFQNSRRLSFIAGNAFGNELSELPPLRSLFFRGTILQTLNGTLSMRVVFEQLYELDLYGVPLQCDCKLIWLKQLFLETNGICFNPARLRGRRLFNISESEFECRVWPEWVYGLMLLGLLCICSAGIYFIVMALRPYRGIQMRHKVGVGSPYARVTIQPNNQEYNHF